MAEPVEGELMMEFELELPEDIRQDVSVYILTVFLAVPMMVLLGFWVPTTVYGALIISAIAGGIFFMSVFSRGNSEISYTDRALSAAVVFLATWGPLAFTFSTPYFLHTMMYTSIVFSFGMFSIVKWYSRWENFWKKIRGRKDEG